MGILKQDWTKFLDNKIYNTRPWIELKCSIWSIFQIQGRDINFIKPFFLKLNSRRNCAFSGEFISLLPLDEDTHFYPFKTLSDSRKSFLLFDCKTVNVKPVGKKEKWKKDFPSVLFRCIFKSVSRIHYHQNEWNICE